MQFPVPLSREFASEGPVTAALFSEVTRWKQCPKYVVLVGKMAYRDLVSLMNIRRTKSTDFPRVQLSSSRFVAICQLANGTRIKKPAKRVCSVQRTGSVQRTTARTGQCPLWVISGQTVPGQNPAMSAVVQKQTFDGPHVDLGGSHTHSVSVTDIVMHSHAHYLCTRLIQPQIGAGLLPCLINEKDATRTCNSATSEARRLSSRKERR